MATIKTSGTQFSIGSAFGTQFTVTAITNASPAVATLSAAHGVVPNDIIELTSGWDLANLRIFRVSGVATNDVTLEGFDTTDTTKYPAGSGTGTGREVSTWTQITQVTPEYSVSGGDQNFADITTIANLVRQQIPTDRNPYTCTLPHFYDSAASWRATVRTAANAGTPYPFRMVFPNNSRLLVSGYWSLGDVPTNTDSTLRDEVVVSFINSPTVYAT
jgi:hypothetical protein